MKARSMAEVIILAITFLSRVVTGGEFVTTSTPLDSNLAYRSPFTSHPDFALDTRAIHKRHLEHYRRKRQVEDATGFNDEHYPTFYGADFSNAPFIWSGGINFTHSVASGDPLDTSVLLWTRTVPTAVLNDPDSPTSFTSTTNDPIIPDQSIPVCVTYSIFDNPSLSGRPINTAQAFTSYDVDWTVKLEATGLKPDTKYFFQFADCADKESKSPVGKTRTIPSANTPAELVNGGNPITFAVYSCSNFPNGWFNAYGWGAFNTSTDFALHLGDYIYEYQDDGTGATIGRAVLGRELATIADYRQRLNQYRTDSSLVALHEEVPWITVWDDHEVADQSWKAGTADSNDTVIGCNFVTSSGACFTDRKLAAVRAYHEWLPIRQVEVDDKLRIWRNFQFGQLMDLTMLDTRQYDRDITDLYYNTDYINTIAAFGNRSMMGISQENWFFETLTQSKQRGALWRIVGQQVVFMQLNELGAFDLDAWDGYRASRKRVLDHLYQNQIENTVILSGDSHANWAFDLAYPNDTTKYNPSTGDGAIGVEFAGTAVSSTSSFGTGILPEAADAISKLLLNETGNEELQWSEGSYRGGFALTVSAEKVVANYFAMRNVSTANLDGFISATFTVERGANKIQRPVAGGKVQAGVLKSSVVGG